VRFVAIRFIVLCLFVPVLLFMSQLATSLPIGSLAANQDEYLDVDLEHLIANRRDFLGVRIRTTGIVKFGISFYMFEDFWLESASGTAIPTVVRFAGLSPPPAGSFVEVVGVVEYSDLEGGFFYLNVSQWRRCRMLDPSHDLNADGKVNIVDIAIAAIAFDSTPTSPTWNPAADINKDNLVNIIDLALIAGTLGL
jgi:hypothetical protein